MNMKMVAMAAILAVVTLSGTTLAQTGLDAPVSTQPTVRSEIKRGNSAAFDCFLKATIDYTAFTNCISAVRDLNEQKSKLSDPFLLGLSAGALMQTSIIKPNEQGGWITVWQKDTARIMKARKLTTKDFCAAVETIKCDRFTQVITQAQSQK